MAAPIRVVIIDDSALVRDILGKGLSADPRIEIVGAAGDPFAARDCILRTRPDVLTLDIEMPRMDGVEFLRRLMPHVPIPTVVCSSLTVRGGRTSLDALDAGAVDIVTKPTSNLARGLNGMLNELRTKVKIAATCDVSHWKHRKRDVRPSKLSPKLLAGSTDKVIAIGASTGGTAAISTVIQGLPVTTPGVIVVQHMPANYTRMFADRLNQQCDMTVKEAESGDRIMQGRVLIAPGGLQMRIRRSGGHYLVTCQEGELVNGHAPSVDVLFASVAEYAGPNAVGVILTGMGADGAKGLLKMRLRGAPTLGQNETTCVVYGMPNAANRIGAVENEYPIDEMAESILNRVVAMADVAR